MAPRSDPTRSNAPAPHAVQRLFFALWPDAALRRRIAAATTQVAATHGGGGRRLRPERYHLTLRFIGSFDPLPESLIDAAIGAADEVRVPAFETRLDRAGSFGGGRVAWLGPSQVAPGLHALWAALGLALERHDVPHDVPPKSGVLTAWTPHVTVLRGLGAALPVSVIPPLAWPVDGFVLVRSQPGREGYDVLQRWKLEDG